MTSKEQKIANPMNYYKMPDEIEHDTSLSTDDKIKVLTNWLDDIQLRETAESENMPSIHNSRGHHIEQIAKLLRKYRGE
ncbi:MAG: hypothetical protein NXI01_05600 [Gammaproteobacteria bacterium]|nr:hypothetical protein [Gammaproteobacteria bacterium]